MIKEKEDNFKFIDDLEIHYIELAKFNKQDINNLNDLEEWLLFLRECNKNGDEKILEKLKIEKEEIKMAVEIMNKLSADEKEYQQYLAREKFLMDEISKKRYAEIKRQELENKLRKAETKIKESETKIKQAEARSKEAEARSKEAEAKIKEAEAKSKEAEAKSKEAEDKIIITIENLLKSGISDEIISASTGLSIDQINEIKRRT